jgi:hypothetical protein
MIKGKGKMRKMCGKLFDEELREKCAKLPDNRDYLFLIVDDKKNRMLPYTQYLHSVVYKYLSSVLPDHPDTIALYKFFEQKFAKVRTCTINGKRFEYRELKSEKTVDVNSFIERVIEYARKEWGIEIPTREAFSEPEMREFYSEAYQNQEVEWNSVISSLKKKDTKNYERRNSEKESL